MKCHTLDNCGGRGRHLSVGGQPGLTSELWVSQDYIVRCCLKIKKIKYKVRKKKRVLFPFDHLGIRTMTAYHL